MKRAAAAGFVVLAALVAGLVLLRGDRGASRSVSGPAGPQPAPAGDADPAPRAGSEREVLGHEADPRVVPDVVPGDGSAPTGKAMYRIRGRVLDLEGTPVGGVELVARGDALTTSEADGRFEYEVSEGAVRHLLEGRAAGWVTVCRSTVDPFRADLEHVVVVARAIDLGGRVVDASGRGLARAQVTVALADELFARFPRPLDLARRASFGTRSDEDGRFRLANVPAPPGARVRADLAGFEGAAVPVPSRTTLDLVLELSPASAPAPDLIVGFVLKPDRSPATGADVRFLRERTQAGDDGAFALQMPDWGVEDDLPLVAALAGFGPAVAPRFGETVLASKPYPPAPVTLVLGVAGLEIAGTVVDAEGAPQRGWRVALGDFTEITRGQTPPEAAEGLAGGVWSTTTDNDGRFVLRGLLPRSYVVRAYDPETMLQVESEPIAAGTRDARLVVEADPYVRVRGRVESRTGAPVAGARVSVGLVTHRSGGAQSWDSTEPVVTDQDGRFVLGRVPRRFVFLDVAGDDIIPTWHELERPLEHEREHVLSVARRCHLRVEVTSGDLDGLAIAVSDANGDRQTIHSFQGNSRSSGTVKGLVDGGMRISSVSEDVRTLHVLRDGEEVHRREIALDPDGVTEIRVELP